ncbi:MAG: hypothetical protein JSV78_12625 [Phycisphaerales bacterium]|nr:MAG: hypothetical protein JSV78_12625 [Phycisphaerales bacterium]
MLIRRTLAAGFIALFFVGFLVCSAAHAQPQGLEGQQIVKVSVTDEGQLALLRQLDATHVDFEIWSDYAGIGQVEVRVTPGTRPLLEANGLKYTVHIPDLQVHVDRLYAGPRDQDFFNTHRTYAEHLQFMNDLVAARPDLAEMVNLGTSVLGRGLWAIRITGPGEDKPGLMYHGAQHGSEPTGAMVVTYIANHLITNYDTDPDVTALVDNVVWYLLPIMNPDGHETYTRHNANNVDLNRNWDGPGSGQDPTGGPFPFSEPETAAMRDFFLSHPNVTMHLDYHGYVPWIMWPWGHTPDHCEDHATFHFVGSGVRSSVYAEGGGWYQIGSVWEVAYPVYGGSVDYTYGVLDLWAFAFEVNSSDLPDICQDFLPGSLFLASWLSDCNSNGLADMEERLCNDCNLNGVLDDCDIDEGASADISPVNGIPDECDQADCNGNGNADWLDIDTGFSEDCNENGVPDECDLATGMDGDCRTLDCNTNGVPDECDIASGSSEDCTGNRIPDECEPDCNDNGIADSCDIASSVSEDCNGNSVPDECDITSGYSLDCDWTGVPDECEFADCNENCIPDDQDVAEGASVDEDGNGLPDECQRVYVDMNGMGHNKGSSWRTAFTKLEDGLAAANPGDQIWVAEGEYRPGDSGADPSAAFHLSGDLALYGGFAGWEDSVDQRDPGAHPTILSGDLLGDDGPGFVNYEDNVFHVVTAFDTTAGAVLDGFIIQGGNARNAATTDGEFGGGLYVGQGQLAVRHCAFVANKATTGGGAAVRDGDLVVANSSFVGNTADLGGGLYSSSSSNLIVESSLFSGNTAVIGGALRNFGDTTIAGTTFSHNSASISAGGVYAGGSTAITVNSCILWGNTDEAGSDESAQIEASSVNVNYSCIQGLTGALAGIGNIGLDPQFVDPDGSDDVFGTEDDDARLPFASPCVNTGDPDFVPSVSTKDLDHHARVLCDRVDMGAFEAGIGDQTCDGVIDLADYAAWPGCLTGPGNGPVAAGCEAYDFDGDEDVDLSDFVEWVNAFE